MGSRTNRYQYGNQDDFSKATADRVDHVLDAEVLADGTVRFFNDVYEKDKAVLDALGAPFRMEPPEV